jgi:hypothetical protein
MRLEKIHKVGNATQIWMLFVAILFVANAYAIGLRDIQESGNPVKTHKAQITPHLAGLPARAPVVTSDDLGSEQNTKPFGELHLLLSLKLSIPENSLVPASNLPTDGGAPQQDAVARVKLLSELNAQIAEMERMIKEQQSQLDFTTSQTNSRVDTSGVIAHHTVDGILSENGSLLEVGNDQSKLKIVAPYLWEISKEENSQVELFGVSLVKLAAEIGLVLLSVIGFVWYRKYKAIQHLKHGPSNDSTNMRDSLQPPAIVQVTLPMDEKAIKTYVCDEKISHSIAPNEYVLF